MHELITQIQRVVPLRHQTPRRASTKKESAALLCEDLAQKTKWLSNIPFIHALDPVRRSAILFLLQFHGEASVFSNEPLLRAIRTRQFDNPRRYLPPGLPDEHKDLLTYMFEKGEFPE